MPPRPSAAQALFSLPRFFFIIQSFFCPLPPGGAWGESALCGVAILGGRGRGGRDSVFLLFPLASLCCFSGVFLCFLPRVFFLHLGAGSGGGQCHRGLVRAFFPPPIAVPLFGGQNEKRGGNSECWQGGRRRGGAGACRRASGAIHAASVRKVADIKGN